jgi:hypothetical protein
MVTTLRVSDVFESKSALKIKERRLLRPLSQMLGRERLLPSVPGCSILFSAAKMAAGILRHDFGGSTGPYATITGEIEGDDEHRSAFDEFFIVATDWHDR